MTIKGEKRKIPTGAEFDEFVDDGQTEAADEETEGLALSSGKKKTKPTSGGGDKLKLSSEGGTATDAAASAMSPKQKAIMSAAEGMSGNYEKRPMGGYSTRDEHKKNVYGG
jgi:hypothetical protein